MGILLLDDEALTLLPLSLQTFKMASAAVNHKIVRTANAPTTPPDETEISVAQALIDLENNVPELKTELRALQISAAREVDVRGGKKAIVVFVPVPQLKAFRKVQQRSVLFMCRSYAAILTSASSHIDLLGNSRRSSLTDMSFSLHSAGCCASPPALPGLSRRGLVAAPLPLSTRKYSRTLFSPLRSSENGPVLPWTVQNY